MIDNRFGFDCLLFERCNLKCKFCLEQHGNSKIDYDYILQIPNDIVSRCRQELKHLPKIEIVSIRLWGGELFFDALPDEIFTVYQKMIDKFNELFMGLDSTLKLEISWLSNGVFTKYDSYDPVDRFSTIEQEELMLRTANYFNDLGLCESISITLTKPNIDCYLQTDKIFKLVHFPLIDINHYVANPRWKELLPFDDDIYSFFKFLLDNEIFNVLDVHNMLMSIIQNTRFPVCNCHRHISHCKGTTTYNCVLSSSIFGNDMFYSMSNISEENVSSIKLSEGMAKRGCLFCEYGNVCIQPCWTSILFKKLKLDVQCPYHRLYDYILSNETILNKFKEVNCYA